MFHLWMPYALLTFGVTEGSRLLPEVVRVARNTRDFYVWREVWRDDVNKCHGRNFLEVIGVI